MCDTIHVGANMTSTQQRHGMQWCSVNARGSHLGSLFPAPPGLSPEHVYILIGTCAAFLLCLLLLILLLVHRQRQKKRGKSQGQGGVMWEGIWGAGKTASLLIHTLTVLRAPQQQG